MDMNHASVVQAGAFTAAVATAQTVSRHRRVKITSSGTVQHAAITEACDGIADCPDATVATTLISVLDRKFPGIVRLIASEAISVGDTLYSAAAGKVSKTSGGSAVIEGKALTAASGDGSEFFARLGAMSA